MYDEIYNKGVFKFPLPGRYEVEMLVQGTLQVVLEKEIKNDSGSNHLPVFFLRKFSIPFMTFIMKKVGNEVLFIYDNGVIIDKLRYISDSDRWLGKLCYKKVSDNTREGVRDHCKQIDWFWFTSKKSG